jgi:sterol desaturase/sphingolipid hydroxylase (fatty acid hydroxylase superfamily)
MRNWINSTVEGWTSARSGDQASLVGTESEDGVSSVQAGVHYRVAALLATLLLAIYVSGVLFSRSLAPADVFTVFSTEIPRAVDFQLDKIYRSFVDYNIFGMMGSIAFLMIVGSAISLLAFELIYQAVLQRSFKASWQGSSLYRLLFGDQSERTDLYMYLYYCFSLDRFVLAVLGLLGPFFLYGLILTGVNIGIAADWPTPLKFFAFILLADFVSYWFHRIAHNTPALWELHKFHHAATSMNFVTAHRNHPLEVALQLPLRAIPIVLIAPDVEEYVLYTALHHFLILLQHSNFNIRFGPLDRVLVSPNFHLTHHSVKMEHCDRNYGVIFSFWDDIFRTRYMGDAPIKAFGVSRSYFNRKGFWYDMALPFARFASAIVRGGKIT